jgi:hypothetical protein
VKLGNKTTYIKSFAIQEQLAGLQLNGSATSGEIQIFFVNVYHLASATLPTYDAYKQNKDQQLASTGKANVV